MNSDLSGKLIWPCVDGLIKGRREKAEKLVMLACNPALRGTQKSKVILNYTEFNTHTAA